MAQAMQAKVSHDDMRQRVDAYFSAIKSQDVPAVVSCFADDGVAHDPVGTPPLEGTEALTTFFTNITAMFERFALTPVHTFVTDGGVAVKWDAAGRSKAGKDVSFEGIDVFEFDAAGKIRRLYAYWEPAAMASQL